MEAANGCREQRRLSPSRIPVAQQHAGTASAVTDLEVRLAEKLSRSQPELSPSRIPRIPPPIAADRALIPTTRLKSHHHDQYHDTQQPQQVINSRGLLPFRQQQLPALQKTQTQHNQSVQNKQQRRWGPATGQQQASCVQQQRSRFPHPSVHSQGVQQPDKAELPSSSPSHKQHLQQKQHMQTPSARARSRVANAANSGWLASMKLHEFLVSQQRKKELYWLSKYGKVLGRPPPASLAKPCANPSSLFRHPATSRSAAHDSLHSSSSSSPLKLPLLASCTYSDAGLAAEHSNMTPGRQVESAAKSSRSQLSQDSSVAAVSIQNHTQLPVQQMVAWQETEQRVEQQQPDSVQQQQQQPDDVAERLASEQIRAKITLANVPKVSVATKLCTPVPLAAVHSHAYPASIVTSSTSSCHVGRQLPCRDLEAELQVLKAIKGREDAVDKLRACCSRLEAAAVADSGATMLLPSDPLGRLFHRLVSSLRMKTLDVIEAHTAWQHKVSGPPEPFIYHGRPYLHHMGEGLGFLDSAPWLAGRFVRCKAVEDCLLVELTPDGVPIDDVTSFDMRRGPGHFSPEALRVHMARRVLAAAGVQPPPESARSIAVAVQQQQQQQHQHQCQQQQQQQQQAGSVNRGGQEVLLDPDQQQQQNGVAISAATAALGILQHSGTHADEVGDASAAGADVAQDVASEITPESPKLTSDSSKADEEHSAFATCETERHNRQPTAEDQGVVLESKQPNRSDNLDRQPHELVQEQLTAIIQADGGLTKQQAFMQQQQHSQQPSSLLQQPAAEQVLDQPAVCMSHNDCDVKNAIDEMLCSIVASLEAPYVDAYPAFSFHSSDWIIDGMLYDIVSEVEVM